MKNQDFLKSFENLLIEVQHIKTMQERTFVLLQEAKANKSENLLLEEECITVKDACRILGCSEVHLWKLRKEGTIPFTKHNRTIRFKKTDILNYINQVK